MVEVKMRRNIFVTRTFTKKKHFRYSFFAKLFDENAFFTFFKIFLQKFLCIESVKIGSLDFSYCLNAMT